MPMKCRTCLHPDRAKIDKALVEGVPNTRIASMFGLTEISVRRHRANHLPKTLVQSHKAAEVAQADTLIARIEGLCGHAEAILARAEAERTNRGDQRALAAIRVLNETTRLLAELAGELRAQADVTVTTQLPPAVVETILDALDPFPEARQAMVEALMGTGNAPKAPTSGSVPPTSESPPVGPDHIVFPSLASKGH